MPWRRVVGGIGRALVGAGLLILLFVAYQLWGTNLHEARAQSSLKRDFERSLATTSTTVADEPPPPAAPPPPEGEAVAVLRIPAIGLEKAVVEGVTVRDLKKAPGHYPGTPMPGQPGNAAIAGHRTTYGAPFSSLDELEPGDEILVTTHQGEFTYEVTGTQVVKPSQVEVLGPTEDDRLTLTTCHPRFSARERLVVTAELTDDPAPPPPTTTVPPGERPRTLSFEEPSLSGDRAARGPTVLWGSIAALVALLTWLAARRWRWPAYVVGAPVFLVVLFVFYENVARLLPANI